MIMASSTARTVDFKFLQFYQNKPLIQMFPQLTFSPSQLLWLRSPLGFVFDHSLAWPWLWSLLEWSAVLALPLVQPPSRSLSHHSVEVYFLFQFRFRQYCLLQEICKSKSDVKIRLWRQLPFSTKAVIPACLNFFVGGDVTSVLSESFILENYI